MKSWRDLVDKNLKDHLEFQVKETTLNERAYKSSKNPSIAQLWVAIANLSRQIFDLNLKIKFLENALKEIGKSKTKKTAKKEEEELKRVLKKF